MKKILNIRLLLLLLSILFTSMSCEKDDQGNKVTYYKNKIGEGYVFFACSSNTGSFLSPNGRIKRDLIDSIRPASDVKIKIHSYTQGFMDMGILRHFDYVYTDNNGKYSFKLLKTINGKSVVEHHITILNYGGTPSTVNLSYAIQTKKGYLIDTLFIISNTLYDFDN